MIDLRQPQLPPGQQLVAMGKWPIIGERKPAQSNAPWELHGCGLVEQGRSFSLSELAVMKQTELRMDIHCVTRWSRQDVTFTGVLLAELLRQLQPMPAARFISFVSRSERNHATSLPLDVACDLNTLIALQVDGRDLEVDHGGPIRNIVPGRYFYKSVKWLEAIELLPQDRLGFWEAQTGYHNNADPWAEERYMAASIDRRTAIKLIESKNFSGRDLRSIDASHRDLSGLIARQALLRDANFRHAVLHNADFTEANLSNAHLQQSDLRGTQFFKTDLEGANLSGADLRNTNFEGSSLIGCSFVEYQADGTMRGAVIDDTTRLPTEILEPLTPQQSEFLRAIGINPT